MGTQTGALAGTIGDVVRGGRDRLRELAVYPRLVTTVYPLVRRELDGWVSAARDIPDAELRAQALASIEKKKFHCVGGSVLALVAPRRLPELVRAIVAVQTISDYLDNLCDRSAVAAKWYAGSGGPTDGHTSGASSMGSQVDGITGGARIYEGAGASAREGYLALMRLHEAMMCAVDPERPAVDFYDLYLSSAQRYGSPPDGGYLHRLVSASREVLCGLPGYCNGPAKSIALQLAVLYSELQSIKHLPPIVRDGWMERWYRERYREEKADGGDGLVRPCGASGRTQAEAVGPTNGGSVGPAKWLGRDLEWWEFGAATGSTLAIFGLICGSAPRARCSPANNSPAPGFPEPLAKAYFPAICGLHILLDYYIDQEEDLAGGDLNFVSHYSSEASAAEALAGFTRWAMAAADACPEDGWLHRAVVRGLLAMYLSDPKVAGPSDSVRALIDVAGGPTELLRRSCAWLRHSLSF